MGGDIPPLPNTPSWHVYQLNEYIFVAWYCTFTFMYIDLEQNLSKSNQKI